MVLAPRLKYPVVVALEDCQDEAELRTSIRRLFIADASDYGGLDSSTILILRGGISRPKGIP